MSKHRVVIVGGGFGGIKAALVLARDKRFHVTLVSDRTHFNHYPTLYKTIAGGRRVISSIPLSEVFNGSNVHLLQDKVVSLDRKERQIKTAVGHDITYDALVLSMGVKTNYFGIKGLEQYSYGMKSAEDAQELKHHLHQQLVDNKKPDLNYVVVGGGPSGVEMAAALPAYLRKICRLHGIKPRAIHVDLIEAAPRVLPRMPKFYSRKVTKKLRKQGVQVFTKASVQAQNVDALMVNNKPIRSHTVIWTAGILNNPFFIEQGFQVARNNKVRVDQYLQAEPGIYVIGDNADTPYSGMAQTAIYDGKFVAKNLIRIADNNKPRVYNAKQPATAVPVGESWAALEWRGIYIYGFAGAVLRNFADLISFHDFEPWKIATKRWAKEWESEENCPMCGGNLQKVEYLSGNV